MPLPPNPSAGPGSDTSPPFGLPVLVEVPELAAALELAADIDRLHRRLIEQLIELRRADLAELATGVALDRWLATLGRFTRSDRRMLATTADVLLRLPLLRTAYLDAQVSWSQLRAVVCAVRKLPATADADLDLALAAAIDGAADADPDALAQAVSWVVADHTPDLEPDPSAGPRDRVVLQPRLDGSGGTGVFDLGPVAFAALDAATAPDRATASPTRSLVGDTPDLEVAATNRARLGEARAAKLLDLCLGAGGARAAGTGRHAADADAAHGGSGGEQLDGADGTPSRSAAGSSVGTLLLRAELSSLLGHDALPAQLLTTLAGGRMHVDAATARRLADRYGFDLRLVLVDDGRVVGVGRRTAQVPGWLHEATLALHDTCSEPGCLTAARVCDSDHGRTWTDGGTTDADNLAPLCGSVNRGPDRRRWDVTQAPDGSRTWRHRRTGLTTRTLPATWRPPPPGRRPPDPAGEDGAADVARTDPLEPAAADTRTRSRDPVSRGCTSAPRSAYRLAAPARRDPNEVPATPF